MKFSMLLPMAETATNTSTDIDHCAVYLSFVCACMEVVYLIGLPLSL